MSRVSPSGSALSTVGWVIGALLACAPTHADATWIERSNAYTRTLLDVEFEHRPEQGSQQGLARFDERISQPTLADQLARRKELEAQLAKIDAARPRESDARVLQDLTILDKAFDLKFRKEDYELRHEVPFLNASETVFQGLRGLLDDQVDPQRRSAAVTRLRRYAGLESGYRPFTALLRQREVEQMAKSVVVFPSRGEMETQLGRNSNYVEGIGALFRKYRLTGWEDAYQKLRGQLTEYDAWQRSTVLPRARSDFRLTPERYALALEDRRSRSRMRSCAA